MSNRNREVAVTINGKTHKVRVTLQKLAEIEELAGSVSALGQDLMLGRVKLTTVTGVVRLLLGDKVTDDDLLDDMKGCIKAVTETILCILNVPLNNAGGEPGEAQAQPPA